MKLEAMLFFGVGQMCFSYTAKIKLLLLFYPMLILYYLAPHITRQSNKVNTHSAI